MTPNLPPLTKHTISFRNNGNKEERLTSLILHMYEKEEVDAHLAAVKKELQEACHYFKHITYGDDPLKGEKLYNKVRALIERVGK